MADLLAAMNAIYQFIMGQFVHIFTTITDNPILYLPVLLAFFSSIVFLALKIVRKLGVRGRSKR